MDPLQSSIRIQFYTWPFYTYLKYMSEQMDCTSLWLWNYYITLRNLVSSFTKGWQWTEPMCLNHLVCREATFRVYIIFLFNCKRFAQVISFYLSFFPVFPQMKFQIFRHLMEKKKTNNKSRWLGGLLGVSYHKVSW